jgi:hypothetical protein
MEIRCKQEQSVHYHRDSIFTCVEYIIKKHHYKTDSDKIIVMKH